MKYYLKLTQKKGKKKKSAEVEIPDAETIEIEVLMIYFETLLEKLLNE